MPSDPKGEKNLAVDPYPGPLLLAFDRATRFLWDWCLVQTGARFQGVGGSGERPYINLRDLFASFTLFASVLSFGLLYALQDIKFRAALGALASYQIFGLAVAVIRLALLGVTRGLLGARDYPDSRLRRLLLLALANYVEFIFWFAVLYCSLASAQIGLFTRATETTSGCETPQGALLLSMSTMLSIGYGTEAPRALVPVLLCTLQGILGLIIMVSLIGNLVSISNSRETTQHFLWMPQKTKGRFLSPILVLIVWLILVFWWIYG
jgi:hypothetical protein